MFAACEEHEWARLIHAQLSCAPLPMRAGAALRGADFFALSAGFAVFNRAMESGIESAA
jgi:hypothetical protein